MPLQYGNVKSKKILIKNETTHRRNYTMMEYSLVGCSNGGYMTMEMVRITWELDCSSFLYYETAHVCKLCCDRICYI